MSFDFFLVLALVANSVIGVEPFEQILVQGHKTNISVKLF